VVSKKALGALDPPGLAVARKSKIFGMTKIALVTDVTYATVLH